MHYGVATTSVIPIRKEAGEHSEMTSQLLFGELFLITEKRKKWWRIRANFDSYEGWIDPKMGRILSNEEYDKLSNNEIKHTSDLITEIFQAGDNYPIRIFPGSEIRGIKNHTFQYAGKQYTLNKGLEIKGDDKRAILVQIGRSYLNSPYLWGGKSPFGIDCSGLTQTLYKLIDIQISRDAKDQVNFGTTLNFLNESKPGDLAFFDNEDGNIIHVGMILESGKILHASGHVKVDTIDHQGIYNHETRQYSHKLRVIQQIISD